MSYTILYQYKTDLGIVVKYKRGGQCAFPGFPLLGTKPIHGSFAL